MSRIWESSASQSSASFGNPDILILSTNERISKKRPKNEAKTTKPDTEWKSKVKEMVSSKKSTVKVKADNEEYLIGSKMSKLDRFLVSESFFDTFPHTSGLILEKGRPYHRPILLKEHMVDFGPTPFRFFHSLLELEGYHNLSASLNLKKDRTSRLASIDVKIDQGCATELDFLNRCESTRILGDIHRLEANDITQKARIKWAFEGDEISSFFHATLKKKASSASNKRRFHNSNGCPPSFVGDMPNVLTPDQIMDKLGFSILRRSWIKGCLGNARTSILVNGSLTNEFEISKGLRQGDPLSPLLFILAMEGLHAFICKVVDLGIYIGVCVSDDIISTKANALGCGAAKMPLKYLGVPVGCNMGRCSNWDAIVQKKISQAYSMECLVTFGLLFKWLWRFLNQPLDLWGTVIKEIHGQNEVLIEHNDSWQWSLDISKGFSVASARFLIDSHTLDTGSSATGWNNNIPIKVNVFLWRLTLNKLPTKMNFDRKCIDVDSLLCPICLEDVETVNHTFFNCDMAKDLWALLAIWWELDIWKRISHKRTKNQAKNDKTEHEMEKHEKPKSTKVKVKVKPEKSTVKTGADIEEYLMSPPEPI
ncbi:RNA-directed DNA polymerase, eukaryota, reverse transcriptase zinc-binding domain protein, partial [Tanacetum coccineum]